MKLFTLKRTQSPRRFPGKKKQWNVRVDSMIKVLDTWGYDKATESKITNNIKKKKSQSHSHKSRKYDFRKKRFGAKKRIQNMRTMVKKSTCPPLQKRRKSETAGKNRIILVLKQHNPNMRL